MVAYKNYMYLSGGYASYLYTQQANCGDFACGDTDASSYRYYMNDIWRSPDGLTWELLTFDAFTYKNKQKQGSKVHSFPRGGHTMIIFDPPPQYPVAFADTNSFYNQPDHYNQNGFPELWVFGGRGGESLFQNLKPGSPFADPSYYYSDIWVSRAQDESGSRWGDWHLLTSSNAEPVPTDDSVAQSNQISAFPWWQGRTGHTVTLSCTWPQINCLTVLPPGVKGSQLQRFVYIVGGQGYQNPSANDANGGNGPGGTFFDDVWAWRPDMNQENFQKVRGWIGFLSQIFTLMNNFFFSNP